MVTPERFAQSLEKIARAAADADREIDSFGTGHLLFAWVDDDYETALDKATGHLSQRYAMDFREPAKKYAALGKPEDVAAKIAEFRDAGVRHFIVDATGPNNEREDQLVRFGTEVRPLLT